VSLEGGFGCPNRDGTLGTAGCVFCNPASFAPGRRTASEPIRQQVEQAIQRLRARYGADRFVAYLQPGTNTYGPGSQLRAVYKEALADPRIVGLIVGTRPDCVENDVLDLLAELSRQTWLLVEYGLQTIHDRTLDWIGRGHRYDAFLDAVERTQERGIAIGAHVILGLPGESRDDMLATARELARLRIDAVKLHNLHAVRDTRLADMAARSEVRFSTLETYAGWVVDFLEELPAECVVDRLSGDASPQYLIDPSWCLDKSAVRAAIAAEFERRHTWQGRRHDSTSPGQTS
jgi:radical SAM protein (TIGR01212 family)